MNSNLKTGRFLGLLFLSNFVIGVIVYQVLQGPVLFADDFLTSTTSNTTGIILSTLLLFLGGIFTIIISVILFRYFKAQNIHLAILYIAFSMLSFIVIAIDNFSVLSLMELSLEYTKNGSNNSELYASLSNVYYKKHWWTHYISLLISCFPAFILFLSFYKTQLIPKGLSIFGLFAVILMFIEILAAIFGNSISMNMMLPIGLTQLALVIWLLIKGLNTSNLEK